MSFLASDRLKQPKFWMPPDLDQFYTPRHIAEKCYASFCDTLNTYGLADATIVEPSAGAGVFLNLMPPERRIGIDIAPAADGIITANFFSWQPPDGTLVVCGNPPFGHRGLLAMRFIQRAATFAGIVGFILPITFASDGKGSPAKRLRGLSLNASEEITADFNKPDGTLTRINAVWQIWVASHLNPNTQIRKHTCDEYIKVVSLSVGGTPSTTRNADLIHKCDIYLPNSTFAEVRAYDSFDELPNRRGYGVIIKRERDTLLPLLREHDWLSVATKSSNGAKNLRTKTITDEVINAGFRDRQLFV